MDDRRDDPRLAAAEPWIPVGELGEAFQSGAGTQHRLARSERLAGARLALHFEDGSATDYHFLSATELSRVRDERGAELEAGNREARHGTLRAETPHSYHATEIRPGIFFLDFIAPELRASTMSFVLDLGRGIFTALVASLPDRSELTVPLIERVRQGGELTCVDARFLSGAIGSPCTPATERHRDSTELVGERIEYAYSASERYEHVYLNERFFTWHCLAGSERALADTDRCRYLKVAEQLYLFVWREKIIPTLGAVLVDLAQMKTTGKIFGYRGFDFEALTNFPVGAQARRAGVP